MVGGAVLSSTNCPQEVPAFDSTGDDVRVWESICLELIWLFSSALYFTEIGFHR